MYRLRQNHQTICRILRLSQFGCGTTATLSQQFFITIRPVLCTIHFGRVKKYTPYLRHRSIVPLFYTYRQAHRRHDSYPCSPDRRPISSIHSVLMFCIPYHLFHLFLRSVEKAFFFIERTHLFHFLVIQFEIENSNILLDIIEVRCSGNDREISLNMPAKNYLDGRFTMYLGYLSDDRLNNAPLDIAPPNRNQQVM